MKQMNIILDFATGRIRIPRDVVVAVGASADFGLLIDMDSMHILVTRNNPFVAQRTRRVGRKPKHRSNMNCWNETEKAFEKDMGVLWRPFRISLGLALRDQGQYSVSGSMISDDAAVFDLADAAEIIPEHDFSGFETVSPSSFNRMTAEKSFTDNNSGAGDCAAPEKEKEDLHG